MAPSYADILPLNRDAAHERGQPRTREAGLQQELYDGNDNGRDEDDNPQDDHDLLEPPGTNDFNTFRVWPPPKRISYPYPALISSNS